jgi:hypothetical protein
VEHDGFECNEKSLIEITKKKFTEDVENLDMSFGSMLRRQSLFKLKEKMNGRVGKQISEIEKRKLSAYRFSNSALKRASNISKKSPSNSKKFSKTFLTTPIIEEQCTIRSTSKSNDNLTFPIDGLSAADFSAELSGQIKRLKRNKSTKRLNANMSKRMQSPLSKSAHSSPTTSMLMHTTQLNYASESFDL